MDKDLISDWFDYYADDVYRFLIYYLSTPDVEDLVQEVFMRAIDRYPSFKGESSPKTWLISIAHNLAIDEARRQKRKDWRKLIKMDSLHTELSPEDQQITEERKIILHQAIEKLKGDYRSVVILRGIEELSVTETAQALKWTESKVRVTFHRALKVLKSEVKEVRYESS